MRAEGVDYYVMPMNRAEPEATTAPANPVAEEEASQEDEASEEDREAKTA